MQSLLILGRQPEIGLAELISLYGPEKVERIGEQAAIVDVDPCNFRFDRLGGSLKFCKVLGEVKTTSWVEIESYLVKASPEQTLKMPEGKMTLGLSLYGFKLDFRSLIVSGIKMKKAIQKTGRSVRVVPNKALELNTAQVIHNKLTSDKAWELVIVKSGDKTVIAQTVKVQDISAYRRRDQVRPYRDSKIGMLPPKLAQIIINLAVGPLSDELLSSVCDDEDTSLKQAEPIDQTILDPFCGTGVVLQEAILMGYKTVGSDINPRMVDYSTKNLEWLKTSFRVDNAASGDISTADATSASWPPFDSVATETNLGKALSALPSGPELNEVVKETNATIENFLTNIAKQAKPGTRLCVAVPAWQIRPNQFRHLPLIDRLSNLGYNSEDFKHLGAEELVYYRPEQIVARQLLVITRK